MVLDAARPTLQGIGNYDFLEKIAEGGMGTVYKGRHRDTGQIVAVKVVAPHMTSNQVLIKRFEQEYNAARQLNHPNIVRGLEYGVSGSTPFLVMEYVEGKTLGQKIEQEGRMPEKEAIRLIAQVAQALHRAHKEKLIHRDVKPDNVLVTPDGIAKLTDLGLVKEVEADLNLTRTGRGLGTPHFMAPEQFKNAKNVDPRCDIYSLGATLYMMVTGEMPFKSSGPLDAYMKKIDNKLVPARELVPGLSERIDWAIRRSMSADPNQRPTDCREFVEDLTGHSTRKAISPDQSALPQQEIWYLVYKDEEGATHTVKGSASGIRRSLKEGLLGDAGNVRASRQKDGMFSLLRSYPEFRDLVIAPAPLNPGGSSISSAPAGSTSPAGSRKSSASTAEPTAAPTVPLNRSQAPQITFDPPRRTTGGWPVLVKYLLLLLLLFGLSALAGMFLFK
jgi:serine/threonine protein kinase